MLAADSSRTKILSSHNQKCIFTTTVKASMIKWKFNFLKYTV